jgi:hypothetical protein
LSLFEQGVKVIFHAFVAPSVKINLNRDRILVVFGPPYSDWDIEKGKVLTPCEKQM